MVWFFGNGLAEYFGRYRRANCSQAILQEMISLFVHILILNLNDDSI